MTRSLTSIYLTILTVLTERYEYQDFFESTLRRLIQAAPFMDLLKGKISQKFLITSFFRSCELLCNYIIAHNAKDYVLGKQLSAIYLSEEMFHKEATAMRSTLETSQIRTVRNMPTPRHISWLRKIRAKGSTTRYDMSPRIPRHTSKACKRLVFASDSSLTISALRVKYRALQAANFVSVGCLQPVLGMLSLESPLSKTPRSVCVEISQPSSNDDAMIDCVDSTQEDVQSGCTALDQAKSQLSY